MMPLFFLIFIVLAVRVAFPARRRGGIQVHVHTALGSAYRPDDLIWAMGQAFFSLSVTGSGMIVYGAYLSDEEDVVGVAQHTALFDTIAAVVAALVIILACFALRPGCRRRPESSVRYSADYLQDLPLGRLFCHNTIRCWRSSPE